MPRYELMYILASSVSDDQVPTVSAGVEQAVADFGGTNIVHEMLGKKKLAYQIGKTRNGHYGVINFDIDGKKIADLDAKIRTQKATIIRHLIVNIDEHLKRLDKDRIVQSSIKRHIPAEETKEDTTASAKPKPTKKAAIPVTNEKLEEEIEKALNEEVA